MWCTCEGMCPAAGVLKIVCLCVMGRGQMQRQVCCGQSHTMLLTGKGTCYAWGHVADGRLGVGTAKRLGVRDPKFIHHLTSEATGGTYHES